MQHASGTFKVSGMNEEPYQELENGGKLTRATGDQAYDGDIGGTGAVQWLMSYRGDGTAHFVGIWRITGSIDGRSGSFVVESTGEFDGRASAGSFRRSRPSSSDGSASPSPRPTTTTCGSARR